MRQDTQATRARIVGAAERLFAERGVDAVSLNEISRAAGQRNKTATQYHFGDKRGLLRAILDKHTPAIALRRHDMLDELEAEGAPTLRPLVRALVLPVAEKLDDADGGAAFIQVNAQLIGHPRYPLLELSTTRQNRGADRLTRLVAQVCQFPAEQRATRFLLITGLLFHGIADYARLSEEDPNAIAPREQFIEALVDAICAVLG